MGWLKKSDKQRTAQRSRPPAAKVLLISAYLSEPSVCFLPPDLPKEDIFSKLVGLLSLADSKAAFDAILEREKMGATQITETVAIPHARMKGLKQIQLAVGILQAKDVGKDGPKLFFLFLTPAEDTKTHLLFLSSLASLLQTEGLIDQIFSFNTPVEVLRAIRAVEERV